MGTGLVRREVVRQVEQGGRGDGRLDDRGAVNADEPEERHGSVDEGESGIGLGCREERLERTDDGGGEVAAEGEAEEVVEEPEHDGAESKRDEVEERLGDVGRYLLRHLDGDVVRDAEVIDAAGHECRDEGGDEALRPEVGAVEAGDGDGVGHLHRDAVRREDEEADEGGDHRRDEADLVVLGHVTVERVRKVLCGRRGDHEREDAHRVAVGLHEHGLDVIRPRESPDVRYVGDEQEDAREDDDRHGGDESVADRLQVLVTSNLVEEGLALLDSGYKSVHYTSFRCASSNPIDRAAETDECVYLR